MNKTTKQDIVWIVVSLVILFSSFILTGFYKEIEITNLSKYSLLPLIDICLLALLPVGIIFFLLGKYRITLVLCFVQIFSIFGFFRISPWRFFHISFYSVVAALSYILLISTAYFLSSSRLARSYLITNNKYFKIWYYTMFVVAFFIITGLESHISQLIYAFLLWIGVLTIMHHPKLWIIEFVSISLVSLILLTFYLGCYYRRYLDMGFIDFSMKQICGKCLKDYFWLASSFILLYLTVNKLKTSPVNGKE